MKILGFEPNSSISNQFVVFLVKHFNNYVVSLIACVMDDIVKLLYFLLLVLFIVTFNGEKVVFAPDCLWL